ncbi:MAG TPA: ABC transporter permease, partial [Dehalococcoidia bacterium]|nr:ABC transporter permease [Dehalococcoidia bacterium]
MWLRWSWRDLRARWLQVIAIAMVIALGTGSYAGLSSVTVWRRTSTDAAYENLRMHDLRVRLADGVSLPAGALRRAAEDALGPGAIAAAEERLLVEVQVDASTPETAILVPGLLYGTGAATGGPAVDAFHIAQGRPLGPDDADADTVLLEY